MYMFQHTICWCGGCSSNSEGTRNLRSHPEPEQPVLAHHPSWHILWQVSLYNTLFLKWIEKFNEGKTICFYVYLCECSLFKIWLFIYNACIHCKKQHFIHVFNSNVLFFVSLWAVTNQYSAAVHYYLQAGTVCSDFFTKPVPPDVYTDQVQSAQFGHLPVSTQNPT